MKAIIHHDSLRLAAAPAHQRSGEMRNLGAIRPHILKMLHSPTPRPWLKPAAALCLALLLWTGCNEKGKPGLPGKPVSATAQTPAPDPVALAVAEQSSRTAIEDILTLVKLESPHELATHMAYKGADKSQHYRRAYDYSSEVEKVDVDKTFAKLQVLLQDMATIDYETFTQEREEEATWNVWQLTMHYQDGSQEPITMAMIDVQGEYLLADLR